MTPSNQTMLRCTSCGQPFNAVIHTVIDVQSEPQVKSLLLSGRLNRAQCPHCGHMNQVVAPLLYHDAEKELLISHVPMEAQQGQPEEKLVGELMNDLTALIGRENFKSYMFKPKTALTLQGLVNLIMEADGITTEMMDEQKQRVELLQRLVEAPDEQALDALIMKHNENIDASFFQTMTLMAQRVLEDGRQDIAMRMVMIQERMLESTDFGKELKAQQAAQEETIRVVSADIEKLDQNASREDLRTLALQYAGDNEKLQALVGLIRPAFDAQFFEEFAAAVAEASAAERETLEQVHQTLLELTQTMDAQMQDVVQQSADFLRHLMSSPQPQALIEANIHLIDENFMTVLNANLQEAQQREDSATLAKLQEIYQIVVGLLQSQMSPELQFLNELLMMDDEAAMMTTLKERAGQYGEGLLAAVDDVRDILAAQGQTGLLARLAIIRETLQQVTG
ncbi:MAG: CpXC domain-containing protein [Aggregatilineales bacterium]